jgi:hypothetical protein
MIHQRAAIGSTAIVLGVVAIIIVAAAGVLVITGQPSANTTHPSPLSTQSTIPSTTTSATTLQLQTTQTLPANFTVAGKVPYLVITPHNNTFTLTENVTANNYPLSLSYDQADSYTVQYSNGTQWLSTSRPCGTGISGLPTTTTSTSTNSSSTTTQTVTSVITTTGIPCGSPNGEWYPVNGTVITPYSKVSSSEVQLTVQPTTIPAHTTSEVQVTVTIEMHPGVYAVSLEIFIQTPGEVPSVNYSLGYAPLIVQG